MNSNKLFTIIGIALISLSACAPKHYKVANYNAHTITIKDTITQDAKMNNFILQYKGKLDSVMNVTIGNTNVPLTKAQPESTMGNFSADAQLEAAKLLDNSVSISVVNYGGLRIPYVNKGLISKGKIYEIMPFDNMITIVEVPGSVLIEFCNHIAQRKGWPISGFNFKIKEGKAIDILVGGEAVRPNGVYKLATSDYVANGGDDCDFLIQLKKYPSSVFLRDAMIEKVIKDTENKGGLDTKIENRISYAN